jgi:hypothetical protein
MANEKISAMTAATTVHNADLLPIVQSGANKKATRDLLLAAPAGENLLMQSNTAYIEIFDSGFIFIQVAATKNFRVQDNAHVYIEVDSSGQVTIKNGPAGGLLRISNNGANVDLDVSGNIVLTPQSGQTLQASYKPANAGDWSGSPSDLAIAIDRIARVVSNSGATPIP